MDEFLEFLVANREAHESNEKFFWMADQYPAANISLRSASPESIVIQTTEDRPKTIGEIDLASAFWMTHPQAIYMHQGQQYFVHSLDLERHIASVTAVSLDYYTQPQRRTELALLNESEQADVSGGQKGWGEIQVTSQVTGFKKLRWFTHENLGEEALDLPPSEMQTTGFWLGISEETVSHLRSAGAWSNDPNDYGPDWPRIRDAVRARDGYRCQVCGAPEESRQHEVHHKTPFRSFLNRSTNISRCWFTKSGDPSASSGQRFGLRSRVRQPSRQLDHALPVLSPQSRAERAHEKRISRTGSRPEPACAALPDVRSRRFGLAY